MQRFFFPPCSLYQMLHLWNHFQWLLVWYATKSAEIDNILYFFALIFNTTCWEYLKFYLEFLLKDNLNRRIFFKEMLYTFFESWHTFCVDRTFEFFVQCQINGFILFLSKNIINMFNFQKKFNVQTKLFFSFSKIILSKLYDV